VNFDIVGYDDARREATKMPLNVDESVDITDLGRLLGLLRLLSMYFALRVRGSAKRPPSPMHFQRMYCIAIGTTANIGSLPKHRCEAALAYIIINHFNSFVVYLQYKANAITYAQLTFQVLMPAQLNEVIHTMSMFQPGIAPSLATNQRFV
jgi:hypothetical protein